MTDRQYLPARGGSMCATAPGVRTESNLKSRAPLALGWLMKMESTVRSDFRSALMVGPTLLMASAKTALAPAAMNPAP